MVLEHETDAILRILAERTIGDRDACRLETLTAADVPQGIRSFFKAEIRRKLEEDLQKSSWFAGIRQSEGGPARVARALVVSLTDAYQFPRQEFLDTLDLAVHFVANYLCRPQWTLENFLFDRSPQISLTELVEGLAYVADYRYLGELVVRTLQRREQREITQADFRLLVGKIDDEVMRQHNARELASLTRPLFTFFQIPGTHPDNAIPIEALLVFFEDKKLRILKEYIKGICHLRNRTHLTFKDLTQLIEELFAGKTAAAAEPVPPPMPEHTAATPEPPAAVPESEPPLQPVEERTVAAGDQPKVNIALSLTFAGLRANTGARPRLPDINTLIQPELRDRFIAQVFKGDAAHYAGALVMLDSLKTWRDAEAYLQELYRINNFDPQAADAVEFSSAVRKRYEITERMP